MDPVAADIPDYEKYKAILTQADAIFRERNRTRLSAFRGAGWKGNLVEARKKMDRLWSMWKDGRSPEAKDFDEALDLINAVVFTLMLMGEDDPNGRWDWP
jgi:hypothetical protein